MAHLTLADSVILNKVSPLFVMILAHFILREILNRWHAVILIFSLFGVYNVIQPQLKIAPLAGFVGLASSVFSASAYVVVKKLSTNHSSPQIVLAFVVAATIMSSPFMMVNFRMPTLFDLLIFAGIGLSSVTAQILMTRAYTLGSPTPVSIASYSVVIFSAFWGFVFFDEVQNVQAFLGTLVVICSLSALPFLKQGLQKGNSRDLSRTSDQSSKCQ